jgi:hypothetical protein
VVREAVEANGAPRSEDRDAMYEVLVRCIRQPDSPREERAFCDAADQLVAEGARPAEVEWRVCHWDPALMGGDPKPLAIARSWHRIAPLPGDMDDEVVALPPIDLEPSDLEPSEKVTDR